MIVDRVSSTSRSSPGCCAARCSPRRRTTSCSLLAPSGCRGGYFSLAPPPERRLAGDRPGHARDGDGDHRRRLRSASSGWGPPDPSTPEWGTMLADVNRYFASGPHLAIAAGHRHRADRPRLQPDRGRPARGARSRSCAAGEHEDAQRAAPLGGGAQGRVLDEPRHCPTRSTASPSTSPPGETLGIVGESGCGKSVTLARPPRLSSSPRRARHGRVRAMFEGRDLLDAFLTTLLRKIRGRDIAMIFQDPMTSLNPVLTIGRQIREALETHFDLDKKAVERARSPSSSTGSASAITSGRRLSSILCCDRNLLKLKHF